MTDLTEGQILTILIEWLGNVRAQNLDAYVAAMPNGVPGLAALQERREALLRAWSTDQQALEERRRLRAEQQARNAPGAIKVGALRCSPGNPSQRGYVGVVEVRSNSRRWLRWTCPHRWGSSSGPHATRETARLCAEANRWRGEEQKA